MNIIDLQTIPYGEAEALQLARREAVEAGAEGDTLYLLEHPRVITFGRNGGEDNLHVSAEFLAEQGIALHKATRGGDVTCHFPGQLVGYPVFRLNKVPGGLKAFFWNVEEAIIQTLDAVGVDAGRVEGRPGVWCGPEGQRSRKIASIGIAVKRWVTYHGLAINVGPDVSLFDLITLCGLRDAEPTSVALELGVESVDMEEMKKVLGDAFRRVFTDSALAQG